MSQSSAVALLVQPDGKIVVVGNVYSEGILLARLNPNGSLDFGFADGGHAIRFDSSLRAAAAALQPDGRILVAGTQLPGGGNQSFFLARFLSNGDPDPAFGIGGLALADFAGQAAGGSALSLQPDGRIVVAGYAGPPPSPTDPLTGDFAAARYEPDGALDPGFGSGGRVVVDMDPGGSGFPEGATSAVIENGGRIVLGGVSSSALGGFALLALLPTGAIDPAFGNTGKLYIDFGLGSDCHALTLQHDGKIVAVGSGGAPAIIAVRLTADARTDPTFGTAGVAMIQAPKTPVAAAIDGLGRIVVAAQGQFVLARFLPNGDPDRTLGVQGWQAMGTDIGGNFHASATALAIQEDGRILLGGEETVVSLTFVTVFRYLEAITPVPALSVLGLGALAIGLAVGGGFALRCGIG